MCLVSIGLQDATSFGPMVFNYDNRVMSEIRAETESNKGSDEGSDVLSVVIKDCTFQNLKAMKVQLGVERGIISVKGPDHDVTIENCVFRNNDFGYDTYMVGNCFWLPLLAFPAVFPHLFSLPSDYSVACFRGTARKRIPRDMPLRRMVPEFS